MVRSIENERAPLERAWTRFALMRDLAAATTSQAEMAKKYGVTGPAITAFKQRHAEAIADIQERLEDELSGILVAQKANRLAMYQDQIEQAEDREDWKLVARLLRQVAEEMGHLPSRVHISGQMDVQTRYVIEGTDGAPISLEDLR